MVTVSTVARKITHTLVRCLNRIVRKSRKPPDGCSCSIGMYLSTPDPGGFIYTFPTWLFHRGDDRGRRIDSHRGSPHGYGVEESDPRDHSVHVPVSYTHLRAHE